MFFVSEEFLRSYETGEEYSQTLDEALAPGQELFEGHQSKADWKSQQKQRQEGGG